MNDLKRNNDFNDIISIIEKSRIKIFSIINRELIDLYWSIGEYVSNMCNISNWGKNVVRQLSEYISREKPDLKGFSAQNIWRMKQFYEAYKENEKLSALLRELSWTNNLQILSKSKSDGEREFYIKLSIKERYSSRELERQINSALFERVMLSDKNSINIFTNKSPERFPLRDNYVFEFLDLPQNYMEKDLRKSIIGNLKQFILECGRDFVFVGEEYRVQVGNSDFYIDLLFFHREICCLVAIELKVEEFKPEFLGKINFYLEALDRDVKKPHEKPSVGLVLCASKDDEVVEYALSRSLSPTMIADYQTKLIDKKILQNKMHELYESIEAFPKNEDVY